MKTRNCRNMREYRLRCKTARVFCRLHGVKLVFVNDNAYNEAITTHFYRCKNNPKRKTFYGRKCRILASGKMCSVCVEFEDGQREIISRRALRKVKA